MPFWKIYHPVGAFTAEDKRALSERITGCYRGLPKFYVIVVLLMQHFQGFFLQQIEIKGLMRSAYGGFRFVCECSHTPISH